jgi:TetR/AcrR family transcriptional repressor of bet genes
MAIHAKNSEATPRKLAKDKQRIHLLEANMECIAKRGLSETSITHISKAATMSRGIINFYFDSKEKLMLETLDYILQEQEYALTKAIAECGWDNAIDTLNVIAESLVVSSSKKRQRVWLAFAAHAASHANYASKFSDFQTLLRNALENNSISEEKAKVFMALLDGLRMQLLVGNASFSREEKIHYVHAAIAAIEPAENIMPLNDNIAAAKLSNEIENRKSAKNQNVKKPVLQEAAIGDLFAGLG